MDRFEVIESKQWVRDDGRTASIYGALPWVSEREKPRWKMITRGYTVRDNERGTVGIGRQPWATRAEAQAWVDKETARLEEARRWHEANYPKKASATRGKRSHATKKSPTQLQREINEALRQRAMSLDPAQVGKEITAGFARQRAIEEGLTPAQRSYIAASVEDVRLFPDAYKASIRADPHAWATKLVEGLSDADAREMAREQRAETKRTLRALGRT